ncbi:MAG: hypothetical protein GY862_22305, partial [Gammaproteobacteria bacterium]|nr:hypothetical protein [Gammaproteobacteria bacterium]
MILILCGYLYYLWQSRKIPEDKKPAWNEYGSRMFSTGQIGGKPAPLLDDAALDQIADSLGYFQSPISGRQPDIDASVQASVKCGGMPKIIFEKRKQIRSLLILEDRFAADRIWNTAASELAAGMFKRGIPVIHGYFGNTPALFRTPDRGLLRLEDLEDHRRGYLLLIFTDGKWAYGTQKKFDLEQLARWPMIAWMDLREPRLWDVEAAIPVRYHIPVYPASPDGIVKAVRLFLTEQASAGDFSAKAAQARGLPPLLADLPDRHIEYLLGDALGWAQDCAMTQPLSPGLADALRKQFHSHLPGQRIGRLYALPGTIRNSSGLQFTDEVLRVLRTGFIQHRDPSEQESVLKFILEKIEAAKPTDKTADKTAPAYLMWELAQERIKMELDAKDDFKRLAQLAKTPLGSYISAELEPYGFQDDTAKIPLRLKKPQNQ